MKRVVSSIILWGLATTQQIPDLEVRAAASGDTDYFFRHGWSGSNCGQLQVLAAERGNLDLVIYLHAHKHQWQFAYCGTPVAFWWARCMRHANVTNYLWAQMSEKEQELVRKGQEDFCTRQQRWVEKGQDYHSGNCLPSQITQSIIQAPLEPIVPTPVIEALIDDMEKDV